MLLCIKLSKTFCIEDKLLFYSHHHIRVYMPAFCFRHSFRSILTRNGCIFPQEKLQLHQQYFTNVQRWFLPDNAVETFANIQIQDVVDYYFSTMLWSSKFGIWSQRGYLNQACARSRKTGWQTSRSVISTFHLLTENAFCLCSVKLITAHYQNISSVSSGDLVPSFSSVFWHFSTWRILQFLGLVVMWSHLQ